MIEWGDVYKVVEAMAPLYVALLLGYASVRWWHMFSSDQCAAINRFICYFIFPFYSFDFTSHIDPFSMNYKYMGADILSKFICVAALGLWCKCSSRTGSYGWFVTCFSLCTMTNSLFIGVPILEAMYGRTGVNLVLQASVVQVIIYSTIFLILLEFWKSFVSLNKTIPEDSNIAPVGAAEEDLEGHGTTEVSESSGPSSFWPLMRNALLKLVKNPNIYACVLGLIWAFLSKRWHIGMPKIVEGSVQIMSRAGTSTAMFSLGFFMAMQGKVMACGATLTAFGMIIRFIATPVTMGVVALAMGLRGNVLRIAIIQAALPQSLASFVFVKEYGLHTEVISTAVILGIIICLPLLVAYYAILVYIR
ncbi:hypothetical protein AAG906_033064 [Vitis piasezkii]